MINRKILSYLCAALTICVFVHTGHSAQTQPLPEFNSKPKYCLFFTVDGLDRDYITTKTTPNLIQWQANGVAFPDAINVYPTLTTPNMTSILTGAFPRTTGIGSNQIFLKNQKKIIKSPRANKAVTIAEAFKAGGGTTAAVQHFMLENHGADRYIHIGSKEGSAITSTALSMLKDISDVPTFMAVLYQTVDGQGHKFGQFSPEVREEAHVIDGEMAKVVNHYRNLGILKDTLIVVSADHGMSGPCRDIDKAALNAAVTNGGWTYQLLVNEKQKIVDNVDLYVMVYANLQCYFNREFNPDEQERLFQAISKVQGIGRIYDSMALRRMGANPNAGDFIVESAHGWWFGGDGGMHGRNSESDGFQMMTGAGIAQGAVVMGARTVDLTPTVLAAFDLDIPDTVDGKVLKKALSH